MGIPTARSHFPATAQCTDLSRNAFAVLQTIVSIVQDFFFFSLLWCKDEVNVVFK